MATSEDLLTAERADTAEYLLSLVYTELERLEWALDSDEREVSRAFETAKAEGASTDEAMARAAAVQRLELDEATTGRLLMFLLDVADDAEKMCALARKCATQVKYRRHDTTGYAETEIKQHLRELLDGGVTA